MPMNAEIKSIWTSKLREPGRTQGSGYLKDSEGRQCCLDLLMEAGVEAGVQEPSVTNSGCIYYPSFSGGISDHEDLVLTDEVVMWAGMSWKDPWVRIPDFLRRKYEQNFLNANVYGNTATLTRLNDQIHMSFADIADAIDADGEL